MLIGMQSVVAIDSQTEIHTRQAQLEAWLASVIAEKIVGLEKLAGDLSFRRYFRVITTKRQLIAMDAPPEKEDCRPFVAVATLLRAAELAVPAIHYQDLERGFLLLDDFGDVLLLDNLTQTTADQLYRQAIDELLLIQQLPQPTNYHLPPYSADYLRQEINYFQQWYLEAYLKLTVSQSQQRVIDQAFTGLIESAIAQPQVWVHRDYHSRNIMILADGGLGVIDFQDAMWGPISYDLVSLLRDCYIAWPDEKVDAWVTYYYLRASELNLLNCSEMQFKKWFDWMGVQRHLKAIYRFALKYCRDNNGVYIPDIPRAMNYVVAVCRRYPELQAFFDYLTSVVPH